MSIIVFIVSTTLAQMTNTRIERNKIIKSKTSCEIVGDVLAWTEAMYSQCLLFVMAAQVPSLHTVISSVKILELQFVYNKAT